MMLGVVLIAALSAGPQEAASEADAAQAKAAFEAGKKLYKQAKYAEAVVKFDEAYKARPHPAIFFNIAKCHEQLGDVAKALRNYRDYLRLLPQAEDKVAVQDSVANLERKLREKGVQQVLIFAEPASAKIEVDGKGVGVSPASVELAAGQHALTVSADGFTTVERSFTVSLAKSSELTVALTPKAEQTPSIPVSPKKDAPVASKDPSLTPADSQKPSTPDLKTPAPKKGRVVTWIAGGTALAALGAGIGLGVAANGAAQSLKSTERSRADATALQQQAQGMATGANIAYGVAGAAAIAAVVLFFVEGN